MSTPLSILPNHAGTNLAEISPLLKLGEGDKNPQTSLQEAIKERFLHFKNHQQATWDEMNRAGEEVSLFMQGKQYLMPNPLKAGGWLPYKVAEKGPMGRGSEGVKRALSIMQYHTSGNLEKWLSSNPDIIITPGVESDDAYESAQAARIIVDHYEKKFFNNKARLQIEECLEGLTFGTYIWRLGFDATLKSITAYRQIFENREIKIGQGWGKCGDCGNEGGSDDFSEEGNGVYTCPDCQGEAMVIPPASDEMPTLARTETVELGDFNLGLVPFSQCRWDLKYHADESPWMIIRKRTTMSAVRQLLGNIEIPGDGGGDVGLDVVDHLAYSGTAQAGYSRSEDRPSLYKEPATIEEFWMSADEYGDIRLQRSVRTVSGQETPGGVRLGDHFKGKSICVIGLNEMSTVLGIYAEDHRDYIVQGKWYAKKGTGVGRGLQDLTEVQKVFNSDHQIIHNYLRNSSTPSMLVAAGVLDEGDSRAISIPGRNITVPLAALSEGLTLDQIVRPAFQPQSVPAQTFQFTYDRLGEFAQFASHFLPFTGGIPGVDNSTATGANITQAATDALYTPPFSVKGEVHQLIFEKLIKQYPKRFPVDRQFSLGGKYGSHTGSYLVKANLCTDLTYEVVKDSWLPRNSFRKQQSYVGFFQLFGGYAGYLQARTADAKRVADVERAFDLELKSDESNVAHSLCFKRVRQMQQSVGVANDPVALIQQIQPPISPAELGHEVKRTWLQEWLDSDPGQSAQPPLRAAVEQLVMLHSQFATQQASYLADQQGQVQVAGAQPGIQAQQEAQSQAANQQVEQQAQGLALKGAEAIGGQMLSQADLENKATEQNLEHSHEQRMNDEKAAGREHGLAIQAVGQAIKGRQ
jgi:hypothetical protein